MPTAAIAGPAPFTAADHAARMRRAAAQAAAAGLAGVLVTPGPDLTYFTGYAPAAVSDRLTLLVLRHEAGPAMILPSRDRADAERATGVASVSLIDFDDDQDPYAAIAPVLHPAGAYAISDGAWALQVLGLQRAVPGLRLLSLSAALPLLRATKDAAEIARLAAAGASADACLESLLLVPFAGRTENAVAADLARMLGDHGHSEVEFTVVGCGPNGADPHHEAGARTIVKGDMVVLDFRALKDGYASDTSRTVHVGPRPTDEEVRVHDVVRRAQQAAFEAVRPGATCQDVDRAARAVVAAAGYGDRFPHRTGHGIGTTALEPPYLGEGEEQPLLPGMCFSVEPGVYLPGRFGVRIEDVVVVEEDGTGRRLNRTGHDLQFVS
ncbi:MAG TPA: M24 family metallopeptidase [Baekduia sp.]